MLVGPMKKRVVLTGVFSALIPIIILGVAGFFIYRNFTEEIATLNRKAEVVQKYVLKEDAVVNKVIAESDVELRDVKAETVPSDSYDEKSKDKLIGRRLKINALAQTILSESMFFEDDKKPTMDLRLQEFNMITLPSDLVENDYIDVRVRFPSGEDYSVLVGKKVESYSNDTIFIKLKEDEILTMGSAIIEAYMLDGTKLYANKYVDPANQLYEYTKVDYVKLYDDALDALMAAKKEELGAKATADYLTTNPEATDEQIASVIANVSVSANDIANSDIANRIGLAVADVSSIRDAKQTNNVEVLNKYRNKINVTDKKIAMTYPVKENVLNIIRSNPNILEEIKANFNSEIILAQRMTMLDTTLTGNKDLDEEKIERIKENLTAEITTQKEERVAYLRSLLGAAEAEEEL